MAEGGTDAKRPAARERWQPGEALPWTRFFWRDWLSDPAIRRMSREQRGAFMDVRAATMGTDTPGVMTEEDVRAWAGYSPKEWAEIREVFRPAFSMTRRKGMWVLLGVMEEWQASIRMAKAAHRKAMQGVEARARKRQGDNEITTTGQPEVQPEVAPGVQPGVNTGSHTTGASPPQEASPPQGLRPQIVRSAVPASLTPQPAHAAAPERDGLSAVGTSGTEAAPAALLERVLRTGFAGGTGNPQGGGA